MNLQENLHKNLNLDKICRACLGEHGEMRPLYGSSLDDMLRSVARIDVQAGDGLPESMCLQCVLQVSRAFRFKQQCERSDHTLRKYIEESIREKPQDKNHTAIEQIGYSCDTINRVGEKCLLIFEDMPPDEQSLVPTTGLGPVIKNDSAQVQISDSLGIILSDDGVKIASFPVDQDEMPTVSEILLSDDNTGRTEDFASSERGCDGKDEENSLITSFQCNVCGKVFPKRRMWRRHLKIHDPVKPHVCKECGMSFTESSNLKKHMKKHTGELRNVVGKPNLCSVCGKGFKWASSLSKHMNHHTKKKILNCPHCPKYYVESRSLRIHLRTHTGEKPYVCDVCDKGFTQMCNLEKHVRVHTGEKPFLCPICGKGFSQSGYVAVHLRSHTGEKPYICPECGKTFAGSNSLAIHKKIHTGEKPFVCNICKKAFVRQESLAIHLRTHTGEKSHVCSVCNRGFTCSSHLTIHMRTHTGEKPYVCKICARKFVSGNSLKAHLKTHEREKQQEGNTEEIKFDSKNSIECNNSDHIPQNAIMILQEEAVNENHKSYSILTLNQ